MPYKDKDKQREHQKKYYKRNKEKIKEYKQSYYLIRKDDPDFKTRQAKNARKWHEENRELALSRSKERNKKIRQELQKIIDDAKSISCMDCGVKYPPYVMDFDHRDPKDKEFTIAKQLHTRTENQLRLEIAKCDVVCANCHRVRTFGG